MRFQAFLLWLLFFYVIIIVKRQIMCDSNVFRMLGICVMVDGDNDDIIFWILYTCSPIRNWPWSRTHKRIRTHLSILVTHSCSCSNSITSHQAESTSNCQKVKIFRSMLTNGRIQKFVNTKLKWVNAMEASKHSNKQRWLATAINSKITSLPKICAQKKWAIHLSEYEENKCVYKVLGGCVYSRDWNACVDLLWFICNSVCFFFFLQLKSYRLWITATSITNTDDCADIGKILIENRIKNRIWQSIALHVSIFTFIISISFNFLHTEEKRITAMPHNFHSHIQNKKI